MDLRQIINAGLLHARQHLKKELPSQPSGLIEGYPGQTWLNCNGTVKARSHLWTDGISLAGIAHVFRYYGLKQGLRNVPERIAKGLANIDRTGHHGLQPVMHADIVKIIRLPSAAQPSLEGQRL